MYHYRSCRFHYIALNKVGIDGFTNYILKCEAFIAPKRREDSEMIAIEE